MSEQPHPEQDPTAPGVDEDLPPKPAPEEDLPDDGEGDDEPGEEDVPETDIMDPAEASGDETVDDTERLEEPHDPSGLDVAPD